MVPKKPKDIEPKPVPEADSAEETVTIEDFVAVCQKIEQIERWLYPEIEAIEKEILRLAALIAPEIPEVLAPTNQPNKFKAIMGEHWYTSKGIWLAIILVIIMLALIFVFYVHSTGHYIRIGNYKI